MPGLPRCVTLISVLHYTTCARRGTVQNVRVTEQRDGMHEGRGGVGKHAASLELTAGKEERNHVSQCKAEVHCVMTVFHY